jgi:paraquat-inducible protein B
MLSDNSTLVNVHALIKTNYAALVRTDTKFWNAGGINVNLKLFGVKISAESFKSLVIGGIAFATPTMPGSPATNGMVFPLNEKLDDKWLTWTPQIGVTNAQTQISPSEPSALLLNKMNPGETKSQPNGP